MCVYRVCLAPIEVRRRHSILGLELWTVLSDQMGLGNEQGPLQEQELLTTEPSLQS